MVRYISRLFMIAAVCTLSAANAGCWDWLSGLCRAKKSPVEVIPSAKSDVDNRMEKVAMMKQHDLHVLRKVPAYKEKREVELLHFHIKNQREKECIQAQAELKHKLRKINEDPLDLNKNENEEEKVTQS